MHTTLFLAFDIGGTTIKYAVIDQEMNYLLHESVPTKSNSDGHILKTLRTISLSLKADFPLHAIGVSTAGIVDSATGSIKFANQLIPGYTGTQLKKELERTCQLPVYVVNDVQAALLGELLQSSLPDKTFCLTLGTGIGGAFFSDGTIYHGAHDYENYIGQLCYDKKTQTNWEDRCSTIALEKKLRAVHDLSVPDAFTLARAGDGIIAEMLEDWIDEIAKGIAVIVLLFDPRIILVGGGVSKQNDYIFPILTRKLADYLPNSFLNSELRTPSSCNENALIGALYPFITEKVAQA